MAILRRFKQWVAILSSSTRKVAILGGGTKLWRYWVMILIIIRLENSSDYAESPAPLWPGGIGARLSRTFAATQPPLQACVGQYTS